MEGHRGGRATPSFKEVVASRGKKPLENARGTSEEEERYIKEETIKANNKKINGTKDKEVEDKKRDPANPKLSSHPELF